jgi:hypothetical protein
MVRPMEVIEEGYRYQLKAFAALSKIESLISAKKYLDKLGFMGVTYRYQVGLQYLNIYRSREYEIYSITLFKSILDNSSVEMILCYDGKLSHPIMCDNRLGNMYNLRENMANSTGE